MKTFILVDFYNIVFRTRHSHVREDIETQIGLSMHTLFNSVKMVSDRFKVDHVVMCSDSSSWRYDVYADYKLNRKVDLLKKTPSELEEDAIFFAAVGELWDYLDTKTNMTTLKVKGAEGDDIIALWCAAHPDDKNIIISTDEDYDQLLCDNVQRYNGTSDTLVTIDGYYDAKGNRVIKKDGSDRPDPEYSLFMKCVRGDSDNIKSSYPRVREKSTKNKVGIREAYEDRHTKGYAYNNFFNQTWEDADDNIHVVKDDFEFNRMLMDLNMQPEYVKVACLNAIFEQTERERVSDIGFHFMKMCAKWKLDNISKSPTAYTAILNRGYKNEN